MARMPIALLAYPKCASTWLRYTLEQLTGRPTHNPIGDRVAVTHLMNADDPTVDAGAEPCAVKYHYAQEIIGDAGPLLVSHRAVADVVPSFAYAEGRSERTFAEWILTADREDLMHRARMVAANVNKFLTCRGDRKMLSFNTLVYRPEEAVPLLASWFRASPLRVRAFMDRYNDHRQRCLALKTGAGQMQLNTRGNKGSEHALRKAVPGHIRTMIEREYTRALI